MQRGQFIQQLALSLGVAAGIKRSSAAVTSTSKNIVHLFCGGGPDFRHLLTPRYSANNSDYGYHFWNSRAASYGLSGSASSLSTMSNSFTHFEDGQGGEFGIHPIAGWLASEFEAGRVAIINNVYGTKSRNHEHASRVFESGQHWVQPEHRQVSGWGGRLAQEKNENILSLSSHVRTFCYGKADGDLLKHDTQSVISMNKSRSWGLFRPEVFKENPSRSHHQANVTRALENYYRAKRQELSNDSPYQIFLQHEKSFRELGEAVETRLSEFGDSPFSAWENNESSLNNRGLEKQLTSLFDSLLCRDILNASTMSLDYGGFDTHKNQNQSLSSRFEDLFSMGGGLDSFFTALNQSQSQAADNTVMVIGGEFGRQLRANGDGGTDHGRGNSLILVGKPIKGGVYGNMFPESEIENYSKPGKDIEGLTHVDQVFAKLADWSCPASSNSIFPQLADADLESASVLDFI
jgi:uncharacterized protein (DUF1501 family)